MNAARPERPDGAPTGSLRRELLLLAASLGASLLLLELGLRIALGAPPAWRYPQEAYVEDLEVGYAMRPLQDAYSIDAPVHVNSHGIRDEEHSAQPDASVVRLLALGDSQTFGVGVAAEETWPKQLERTLGEARPGVRFEVLNAGLPASASRNQARLLPRLLDAYHPSCVVLGFYVNDVIAVTGGAPFSIGGGSNLARRLVYVAKRSALFSALLRLSASLRSGGAKDAEAQHERAVLRDEAGAREAAGWREVESSLEEMRRESASRGACFVMLAMPRADQVDGREPARGYQQHLRQLADRLGLPLVDPIDALRAAGTEGLLVPWDGHYAGAAQAAMARALTPALLTALDGSAARSPERSAAARRP